MTSKAGHTAGPWRAYRDRTVVSRNKLIADCRANDSTTVDEADANARFIAETFTVAHETGLTPRQLAEQRDELVKALREIETICIESAGDCRRRMGTRVGNTITVTRAALAKATAGGAV